MSVFDDAIDGVSSLVDEWYTNGYFLLFIGGLLIFFVYYVFFR